MDFIRELIGGVLGLVAFIGVIIYGVKLFKNRKGDMKPYLKPFGIAFGLMIVAGIILPTEDDVAPTKQEATSKKGRSTVDEELQSKFNKLESGSAEGLNKTANNPPAKKTSGDIKFDMDSLTDSQIAEAVKRAIGDNFDGKPLIEEVLYSDFTEPPHVLLKLRNSAAEHLLLDKSNQVLKELQHSGYQGDVSFFWLTPAMDQYGNKIEIKGLNFRINNDDLQKINFDRFLPENLKNLVKHEGYSVHHTVQAAKY